MDKKLVYRIFNPLSNIFLKITMSQVKFLQTNQKLKLVPSPGEEEIVPLTFAWLQKLFPLSPFAPSNAILQNSFLVLTLQVFFLKDKMPFWAINKRGWNNVQDKIPSSAIKRVQKRIKIKVKSKHKNTKMGENISWIINKGGAGAKINFWFLHLRAIAFLLSYWRRNLEKN